MKKKLVVTVGNRMMGDDALGPLLAQKLQSAPLEDWDVLDGGSAPENFLYAVREMRPSTFSSSTPRIWIWHPAKYD